MRIPFAIALALVTAGPAAAQQRPGQFMAKYGWRDSLTQARAEASRTDKPIFLVFRCEP